MENADFGAARRAPPRSVTLLIPVWGTEYVRRFLDVSLPTLLAPGNIPGLAEQLPCEFVFLTSEHDIGTIAEHEACRVLDQCCTVRFVAIDDLITDGSPSITVTLAYERMVRLAGDAMLETCFFFLVSDYIVADGSLRSCLQRIMAGYSGVLTGNFQIAAEESIATFCARVDRSSWTLRLGSRELMRQALRAIHPVTAANTVNFGLCHSTVTNRLFWRADGDTLIGRFFLMHMIAIRPETTNFVIRSSCDYSFIPEMCPSGNVAIVTDSDEYLVIEAQPRRHENRFLRLGPMEPLTLAKSLSDWTTAQHRENARHTLLFHAADLGPSLQLVLNEAEIFINTVRGCMSPTPQPYRDHPFWTSAIADLRARGEKKPLVSRARFAIFGSPPRFRAWHPRWRDMQLPLAWLKSQIEAGHGRLLVVSPVWNPFDRCLSRFGERVTEVRISPLLTGRWRQRVLDGEFDHCFLHMTSDDLPNVSNLMNRITSLLRANASVCVFILGDVNDWDPSSFGDRFLDNAARFLGSDITDVKAQFVPATGLRRITQLAFSQLGTYVLRAPLVWGPIAAILAPPLALAALLGNLTAKPRRDDPTAHPHISSIVVALRIDRAGTLPRCEDEGVAVREKG